MKRLRRILATALGVAAIAGATVAAPAPAFADTCPGQGPNGEQIRLVYAVPNNRTSMLGTREAYFRSVITYMDNVLDYSSGPKYDQDIRYRCSAGQVTIEPVSLDFGFNPVANDPDTIDWWQVANAVRSEVIAGTHDKALIWVEDNGDGQVCCYTDDQGVELSADGLSARHSSVLAYPYDYAMEKKVEMHELWHIMCQNPDTNSCAPHVRADDLKTDEDGSLDESIDILGGDTLESNHMCGRVQVDCGKNNYYSAGKAAGEINRFDPNSPWPNTATSPWLTPVTLANSGITCAGLSGSYFQYHTEDDDVLTGWNAAIVSLLDGNDSWDPGAGVAGNNTACGGDGADTLMGRDGTDTLVGGAGGDTLHGGAGDDAIYDGPGRDFIDGGGGVDTFYSCSDMNEDTVANIENPVVVDANCYRGNFYPVPPGI